MENKTPRTNENEKLLEMLSGIKIISQEYVSQLETELADKDRQLAEAKTEIERLKQGRDFWRNKCEREESEAGKAMISYVCREQEFEKQLAEARADADHWKSECNALRRMVHEARAEIKRKNRLVEQMREALSVLVASATPSGPLWHGSAEMQIARAALEAERGE